MATEDSFATGKDVKERTHAKRRLVHKRGQLNIRYENALVVSVVQVMDLARSHQLDLVLALVLELIACAPTPRTGISK